MQWHIIFRDFIQPFLFVGLFTMTFISLMYIRRADKRAHQKLQQDLVANAKKIIHNYQLLQEAAKGHKHLTKVLKEDHFYDGQEECDCQSSDEGEALS